MPHFRARISASPICSAYGPPPPFLSLALPFPYILYGTRRLRLAFYSSLLQLKSQPPGESANPDLNNLKCDATRIEKTQKNRLLINPRLSCPFSVSFSFLLKHSRQCSVRHHHIIHIPVVPDRSQQTFLSARIANTATPEIRAMSTSIPRTPIMLTHSISAL